MDIAKFGKDLISLVEKVAPLVGLEDEVRIGKDVVEGVIDLATNAKTVLTETDQAKLGTMLDELVPRVKAHAAKTKASLAD